MATELVHQLLAEGWDVRASVRSLNNEGKTKTLRALGDALPGDVVFAKEAFSSGSQRFTACAHVLSQGYTDKP